MYPHGGRDSMGKRKIGAIVESFKCGVKGGIEKAAALQLDGIQVYVTYGEMAPENLTQEGRKHFKSFVESKGLKISALCGDLGHGFVNAEQNPELVEKTKAMLDLCRDLQTPILTTHIGEIPTTDGEAVKKALTEALEEIGTYAESIDCFLATETGPVDPTLLNEFLESLTTNAVQINYDPANLEMCAFDSLGGVDILKGKILHTHAKDGLRPENGGPKEVPLGEGDVPFAEYIAALDSAGFDGFYTIEREVGENPAADIEKARDFLRTL